MIFGTNNLRTNDTPEKICTRLSAVIYEIRAQTGKTDLIASEVLLRGQDLAFEATEIGSINIMLADS